MYVLYPGLYFSDASQKRNTRNSTVHDFSVSTQYVLLHYIHILKVHHLSGQNNEPLEQFGGPPISR